MENQLAANEELVQRLTQLALRQLLIDKSTLKVGMVCVVFPVPSRQHLINSLTPAFRRTCRGHHSVICEQSENQVLGYTCLSLLPAEPNSVQLFGSPAGTSRVDEQAQQCL
jgi:hypothetical protein